MFLKMCYRNWLNQWKEVDLIFEDDLFFYYYLQGVEQQCENICLIPELCYLTGLTDELRSDFRVMKVSLLTSNNISSFLQKSRYQMSYHVHI